jgi:hypothetical protein
MTTAGEAGHDVARVLAALEQALVYVASHDHADSARANHTRIRHSPLRTLLEHASEAAKRIETYIAHGAAETGPGFTRDGGPA